MIAPEANAEFAAAMDEVLETYERLPNPSPPVVCMDGQPVQWVNQTHEPLAAHESGLGA